MLCYIQYENSIIARILFIMHSFTLESPIIRYLRAHDPKMGYLTNEIGTLSLRTDDDYFGCLVRLIIAQQLSSKVASKIWSNFRDAINDITPVVLNNITDEQLRECGISLAKATYIKNISQLVMEEKLDLHQLAAMNDTDVITRLTEVRGIGRWTAEMFLIFALGRLDVWSISDVGLKRSINWLYNVPMNSCESTWMRICDNWKPYRTVAALYLWEANNRKIF